MSKKRYLSGILACLCSLSAHELSAVPRRSRSFSSRKGGNIKSSGYNATRSPRKGFGTKSPKKNYETRSSDRIPNVPLSLKQNVSSKKGHSTTEILGWSSGSASVAGLASWLITYLAMRGKSNGEIVYVQTPGQATGNQSQLVKKLSKQVLQQSADLICVGEVFGFFDLTDVLNNNQNKILVGNQEFGVFLNLLDALSFLDWKAEGMKLTCEKKQVVTQETFGQLPSAQIAKLGFNFKCESNKVTIENIMKAEGLNCPSLNWLIQNFTSLSLNVIGNNITTAWDPGIVYNFAKLLLKSWLIGHSIDENRADEICQMRNGICLTMLQRVILYNKLN